jgi:hypothetical protein
MGPGASWISWRPARWLAPEEALSRPRIEEQVIASLTTEVVQASTTTTASEETPDPATRDGQTKS